MAIDIGSNRVGFSEFARPSGRAGGGTVGPRPISGRFDILDVYDIYDPHADIAGMTSAELIPLYQETQLTAGLVTHTEAEDAALPPVQDVVSLWLQARRAGFVHPEASSAAANSDDATGRIRALTIMLDRFRVAGANQSGINGFELDASEALDRLARAHQRDVATGAPTTPLPALDADPVRALPLLRYVRPEDHAALLRGTALEALLPQPVETVAPAPTPTRGWAKVREMGTKALEWVRHPHFSRAAIGKTALATELDESSVDVASGLESAAGQVSEADVTIESNSAQSAPDREILTADGRVLRLVCFWDKGDPAYAELTEKIVANRLEKYKANDLLEDDAPLDNIRGPHVEFFAVLDENGDPVASLRKVHATGATIADATPHFRLFRGGETGEGAFSPEGLDLLAEHMPADRPVVEIAALWKDPRYGADIKVEMYKAALQDSMRAERDELWFMAIVQGEYAGLRRTYGPRVIHQLGSAVQVLGAHVKENVRLAPVMVEPRTFYDDMVGEVHDAHLSGDRTKRALRAMMLGDFLMGFDWNRLSARTRGAVEGFIDGTYN